jgi:hypothetical protein
VARSSHRAPLPAAARTVAWGPPPPRPCRTG